MKKVVLLAVFIGVLYLVFNISWKNTNNQTVNTEKVVVSEESAIVSAVKKVTPSVVTVSEEISNRRVISPFGVEIPQEESDLSPKNIGSGFIVSQDGLIVTNKHVVSDIGGKYHVITHDEKDFTVKNIYRDPLNDIAILKIDPSEHSSIQLIPVGLGDSSNLQVGQLVIAIGTPLGEFSNTVTSGIISGLGRGIQAGNPFEGFVEELDNVIQTDAAISPGNSGGPLVNSSAQVIGVNTAIAQGGQNIGFALPINLIKDSLKNFNETGKFQRAYLGVSYRIISRELSIVNEIPEGAYIQTVVEGSAADDAGIQNGDIITKIDGVKIEENTNEIAQSIGKKKIGDTITITIWRDGKTENVKATLKEAPSQ